MTFGRSLSSRVSEIVGCTWRSIYLSCRQSIVSSFWSIIISHFDERSMLPNPPSPDFLTFRVIDWRDLTSRKAFTLTPLAISSHPHQLLVASAVSWRLPRDCDNPYSHPAECWRIYAGQIPHDMVLDHCDELSKDIVTTGYLTLRIFYCLSYCPLIALISVTWGFGAVCRLGICS